MRPGPGQDVVDPTGELLTRLQAAEPDVGLPLFDRFADRIHDFALFLTRDPGMAAQTTQDVIVTTTRQGPGRLTDPAALRAWLYARARDETFALLSTRGRTPAEDRVVEVPVLPPEPTAADLGGLVWTATAAFSERDQALVTLHLRHGLAGEALADAMGLSVGAIEVLLQPTLERVETQLRALLALATGQIPEGCAELRELRGEWDGTFSPLVRGRASRLLTDCGVVPDTQALVPSPLALLQAVPLVPAPASLREAVGERLALSARLGGSTPGEGPPADHTIPPPPPADDDVTVPPDPPGRAGSVRETVDGDDLGGDDPSGAAAPADGTATTPVGATSPVAAGERSTTGEASGQATVGPRHPRLPLPLAIALGIAVGLVLAAALLRVMTGQTTPIGTLATATDGVSSTAADLPAVATPLSGAAQAALEAASTTPGRLSVTGDVVTVDREGTALRLTNSGGATLSWRVEAVPAWLSLDRSEGEIEPGATVEVAARLAEGLPEGDYQGAVDVAWAGRLPGTARIAVAGVVDRRPDLRDLQVGARELVVAGCGLDRTEMAVTVTDESELESVAVTVTGPGSDTQTRFELLPDATRAGRYLGVVGPFQQPGTLLVEISAIDVRGNEAEAAGGDLVVAPC